MKVNLKKIGAIVAGATMLASTAAFAGLMYESTTLVDSNGAPVAKVVIGANAKASDGVAGALIAGKMVSEAHKADTLTAQVSGTATCTAGTNGNASGTCAISNEKARLEITVPGAVAAGTWTGSNLIGDFLNRELLDRVDNVAGDDDAEYPVGGSDTTDDSNPFTDGTATGDLGESEGFFYKVDGSDFTPFADATLSDVDSGNNYVEMQALWLKGDNHFDTDPDDVVGRLEYVAYSLKFDGPGSDEVGIPVCTDAEDGDYSFCKSNTEGADIDDATETHRLKVHFLGEEWIISEMNAPNNDPTTASGDGLLNENLLASGGSVKLAKEAVSGILNQGESLPVDDLKFQLDDLEAHGDITSAILSVLDANGNVLKKDKVDPGQTKEFTVQGETYRFHVYKVAPGYTFGAKWADVAIFAEELELVHGDELDADEDSNPDYEVVLGWKNLDGVSGAAVTDGGNPEQADALRTIVIFSDSIDKISSNDEENLEEGDYISIVQDPVAWKLSYKGLDITSEDRYSLTFDIKTSEKNFDVDLDEDGTVDDCRLYPPYVKVESGASGSVFEVPMGSVYSPGPVGVTTLSSDEFYVAVNNDGNAAFACDLNLAPGDGPYGDGMEATVTPGSVIMELGSTTHGVAEYGIITGTGYGIEVGYEDIGDGDDEFAPPMGGAILIEDEDDTRLGNAELGDLLESEPTGNRHACDSGNCAEFYFAIAEEAGTGGDEFVDYMIFGIADTNTGSPGEATFDFSSRDGGSTGNLITSDDDEILYGHAVASPNYYNDPSGPVDSDFEMVEEDYITERGSVFRSIDSDSVEFDMAHELAYAQWFLASETTSTDNGSTTIVTLGEGESTTVSGVTVKVLEITETVGACSAAGGAASCTADMTGVSAMITGASGGPAASVTVHTPYDYSKYGNLVILDSEASGVNTLVSVGGDKVNTVTASLLQGSAVDWTAETKVVKEVVQGSKIVVAGKEASDTLAAAQDFVAALKKV